MPDADNVFMVKVGLNLLIQQKFCSQMMKFWDSVCYGFGLYSHKIEMIFA